MPCEKTTVLRSVFPLRRPSQPFALNGRLVTKWIYRKRKVVIKWIQLYPTYNHRCRFPSLLSPLAHPAAGRFFQATILIFTINPTRYQRLSLRAPEAGPIALNRAGAFYCLLASGKPFLPLNSRNPAERCPQTCPQFTYIWRGSQSSPNTGGFHHESCKSSLSQENPVSLHRGHASER